ncbi:MAG: LETM1 domain-containing protein [Myxococcota bacterium]|nr:LETM1 domain-containing protein [Myxococcota bacterium]
MIDIDLDSKNWLVPFVRELVERFDGSELATRIPNYPEEETLWHWRLDALERRGVASGLPRVVWPKPAKQDARSKASWLFLNTLAQDVELLLELRQVMHGPSTDSSHTVLQLLMVLAEHCGDLDDAESLYELDEEGWTDDDAGQERLAKQAGPAARCIASKLKKQLLLAPEHPLLGLPLHRVVVYADTLQLLELAVKQFANDARPDAFDVSELRARTQAMKLSLVELLLGLACADHEISAVEKRLAQHIASLAELSPNELRSLWPDPGENVNVEHLAKQIPDQLARRFVYQQLVLQANLEDDVGPQEEAYLHRVAAAFGYEDEQRLLIENEAIALLERHPELLDAFKLGGALNRFRRQLGRGVESAVRKNLGRLVQEIRETKELAQLLAMRTQRQLSEEEEAKVKAQIIDICKAIPALAVFAAPGGTVLLPILMKLLPFDLMPSSFSEEDEKLG